MSIIDRIEEAIFAANLNSPNVVASIYLGNEEYLAMRIDPDAWAAVRLDEGIERCLGLEIIRVKRTSYFRVI